jgi:hypothetical protein
MLLHLSQFSEQSVQPGSAAGISQIYVPGVFENPCGSIWRLIQSVFKLEMIALWLPCIIFHFTIF